MKTQTARLSPVGVPTDPARYADTKTATAEDLKRFAIDVRGQIPHMDTGQLDELEAYLIAVDKRLRQLGKDAAEARRSRVEVLLRLGELLGPGRPGPLSPSENPRTSPSENPRTRLSQAQMDRRKHARLLAEFADEVHTALATDKPVSLSRMVRILQQRRSARDVPMPERLYPILYVDPPWRYDGAESGNRQIENQYGTMDLAEIKRLKPPAAEDAVLFFWVTSPKLADGLEVLKAWDFTYRTCMVWVKDRIGMGYYARQQHELLLIAKRGNLPVPEPANRPSSVFHGERSEHSAKPDAVYELIEAMYPEYDRGEVSSFVELFCRRPRDGWVTWGLDTAIT